MQQVRIPKRMQEAAEWANLVDEIEIAVEDTGMIKWVGSADGRYAMSWRWFKRVCYDAEYRVSGGYQALAGDLVVVLDDDTWYEYDQSAETWVHRYQPALQPDFKPFSKVTGQGWCSLAELNADD